MFAPRNILVPTDFSDYSDKALQFALDMAKPNKAKVHLLHVIGIINQCTVEYCLDKNTIDQLERDLISSASKQLQEQLAKIGNSKSVEIVADIRSGSPYEEILKYQQEKNMDLIVIGSQGKTGLLHQFLGSVADRVTKHAKCPVLLVKGVK